MASISRLRISHSSVLSFESRISAMPFSTRTWVVRRMSLTVAGAQFSQSLRTARSKRMCRGGSQFSLETRKQSAGALTPFSPSISGSQNKGGSRKRDVVLQNSEANVSSLNFLGKIRRTTLARVSHSNCHRQARDRDVKIWGWS